MSRNGERSALSLQQFRPHPAQKKPREGLQLLAGLLFTKREADGIRTRNHRIDSPVL